MRLLLLLSVLTFSLTAGASVKGLVDALAAGKSPDAALLAGAADSADGLMLLGWLADGGRYGQPQDQAKAKALLQRAAEQGSMAALRYCWERCVTLNEGVRARLAAAAAEGEPQALYLGYRLALTEGAEVETLDRMLLAAARAGQPEAIGQLYADHFLTWAGGNRTVIQAARKLERCRAEGIVFCYYLTGALHERRGDHENALLYFQMLRWIDPLLFERYLSEADLAALQARLPQQSLEPLRSRAATQLATQPASANPRIDRFRVCRERTGSHCVTQLAERDAACVPAPLEQGVFKGFRQSEGYRRCLGAGG